MNKPDVKKLILLNLPYVFAFYFADKIAAVFRLAPGTAFIDRLTNGFAVFGTAFANPLPSFHPVDLLIGVLAGALLKLAVYIKGKNRKKFRQGEEYGSARWGKPEDIKPYMDPEFSNNVILTQTEFLTMNSRPKQPKYARNKNILVIGGSGSGKTRFFVKPNLMQMHSSYVVTDPKGTVLVECGKMLEKGGYVIKSLNTINFRKSMHYNPFSYIRSEKDILKLVNIKGFFDNVNHSKLMRQIWAMGIHDKQLIFIIKRILKAPIRMPDGTTLIPDKGTPQGGIISPLLANIVLNELDKWVESQWQNHPLVKEYGYERKIRNSITSDRSKAFLKMRKTGLKEMYIVRYADDFRIFCRNKEDALRTKEAVTAWITERLRLEVSPEKTRIVNVRKRYSEFLGFKIRVRPKSRKYIVQSHICDKKLELERQKLVEQAKRIARPSEGKRPLDEIRLYNSMVLGIQNYFQLATCISIDCRKIHRQVMTVLTNRLNTETGCRLVREGGAMTESEKERFGKSAMIRYVSGIDQPIYPIAYIKNKIPMAKKAAVCSYTVEGRALIHTNLSMNSSVLFSTTSKPSV